MKNSNEPAFPDPMRGGEQSQLNQSPHNEAQGFTKREYFAGLAMQGLLTNYINSPNQIAADAIAYADALLKQLETK